MKAKYIQPGNTIDYKNTGSSDITYGSIVPLGTARAGVAAALIPAGQTGALHLCGVFLMDKDNAAIALGAKVYYDPAADKVSATAPSKDGVSKDGVDVGICVAAAAASDLQAAVKIG